MDEKAIEKLLVGDWASGLRVTTMPQAMGRLGIIDEVDARWHAANAIYDLWQSVLASPEKLQSTASAIGLTDVAQVGALSQRWLEQVVT